MDTTDPIEARTQRLLNLRLTDPVAAAICDGKRGVGTIAKHLGMDPADVLTELNRLLKAKAITKRKYQGKDTYKPASQEMGRLARRSYKMRMDEKKYWENYDFPED